MSDKSKNQLSFLINIVYYTVIVAMVYVMIKYVSGWVLPFILAFCIVTLIHPVITKTTAALKIKQEIIAVLVMLVAYGLLGLGIFWVVMRVVVMAKNGLMALPGQYEKTIAPTLNQVGVILTEYFNKLPFEFDFQFSDISGNVLSALQSFIVNVSQKGISLASGLTNSVPSFFIGTLFTIMLSFFMSTQYDRVLLFMKTQLSQKAIRSLSDIKSILFDTVFKYVKAYLILMTITFTELSIGFIAFGVENPFGIAVGIAIFDALPFFGTGAIMIPWILVELIRSNFTMALRLGIVYGVVTVIRSIIEPKIVGDQLGLNPIISLSAIYLGFKLFGVLGMIMMPIVVQIIIALQKNGNIKIYKEIDSKNRNK